MAAAEREDGDRLATYRAKRDFSRTAEPEGAATPAPSPEGARRFVVQRHRARRLHYDLRFEIDGVLVSWAVPKGPTLDPRSRRLAVHVEDHPLDYFDFEGRIPEGEYGGGDVIVWDWGTWEPSGTDDPAAAVAAGELHAEVHGEKLAGKLVLIRREHDRSGGSRRSGVAGGGKEQWLLLHKRDDHAVPGWDPEDHPRSVKSGLTNDEVAATSGEVWLGDAPPAEAQVDLSAAVEEPLPSFIRPMNASPCDGPFSDPGWMFELKWDGFRVQARVDGGRVQLRSRKGQSAEDWFPDLAGPPTWISARSAIVDGEVVAVGPDGRPSFSLLQDQLSPGPGRRRSALVYQVFDLLHLDGRSLVGVPLGERRKLLRSVLRDHRCVRATTWVDGDGEDYFEAVRAQGLEGVIAKRRASRYQPGVRSRDWLKIKARNEQEFVVCGWEPARSGAPVVGSLQLGVHDDEGVLVHVGGVGTGFTSAQRRDLAERLAPLAVDEPPCRRAPRSGTARWVRPELVVRCEFAEWTGDEHVRQASFKGLAPDRDAATVRRERPLPAGPGPAKPGPGGSGPGGSGPGGPGPGGPSGGPAPAAPPAAAPPAAALAVPSASDRAGPTADELAAFDALGSGGSWRLGGRTLKLTNLDKVLFPGRPDAPEPLTKGDLVRYYATVAPVMLPYLVERPVNLHRYPNGVDRPGFWHKEVPGHAPLWLRRWRNEDAEPDETQWYFVPDSAASLAWLANYGAIELHPWTARIPDVDRPTYALIDIDPGPRTAWDDVLLLARLYRTALDHLGVLGVPKVTGQRGIQVWVPIAAGPTFDDTRAWVEKLSRTVGTAVPELVSWAWEVRARKGLARLDFTQNARNKTLVAPYSVRPAPGAPVSVPITWDELENPGLRPDGWTIRTVGKRLATVGDPFADLLDCTQQLPDL